MAWQRFNRTTGAFEVSDDNGATWQALVYGNINASGTISCNQTVFANGLSSNFGVFDYGRTTPMGVWTNVSANAANFIGATLQAQYMNAYSVVGYTMLWNLLVDLGVAAPTTAITFVSPLASVAGFSQGGNAGFHANAGSFQSIVWHKSPGDPNINVRPTEGRTFNGNIQLWCSMAFRMV